MISWLAKFSRNPSKEATTTLRKFMVGYLKASVNEHCIRYSKKACYDSNTHKGPDPALHSDGRLKQCSSKVFNIHSYADATHQSPKWCKGYEHSGGIVMMCGAAVHAKSGKQSILGHSTSDCEVIALVDVFKPTQFFITLCNEAGHPTDGPTDHFEDDMPAAQTVTSSVMKKKNWHLAKRCLAVRAYVQDSKQMRIYWIKGKAQVADVLTKGVTLPVWRDLVPTMLGMTFSNPRMHSIEMKINATYPECPDGTARTHNM